MIGQTIGHYKIVEKLGAGGMGEVYRAEDTTLKRNVALKVLPPDLAASQERLERFQREAESLAALNHPNIVMIHTVEEAEGTRFLTMELVEGKQLSALIPKGGMALERIFEIAVPLADALAAAHDKGVIHRDLKPGNIMVSTEGRVKVLDFGLAKLRQEAAPAETSEVPTEPLTEEGNILGTVPYMSPEQLESKELDPRSDIFSLGVILYEMAIGQRPFKGDSSVSLIFSIARDTPPDVDTIRGELPHHLSRIIAHCMEKDPEDRLQSIKDVRNELKSLKKETESEAISASRVSAPPPTPRLRWRWPLVVSAAAVVLSLVLYLAPGSQPRAPKEGGARSQESTSDAASDIVRTPERKMIVVLPFKNFGSPEDDYFTAGMTEEITSRLAMVRGMGVISRSSAVRYADSDKSTKEIGAELGVDYVLEGTVRWAQEGYGDRVRITPQLIQVSDDTHLWVDTYDRVIADFFALQLEIAESVITELGVTLLDTERQLLAVELTENPAAYKAYLKGLEISYRSSTSDSWFERPRRAAKMFERAVTLDPTFARAWAWLSRMKALEHMWGGTEPGLIPAAKAALDQATELAPEDPYVRLASGYYKYYGLRNFDRALQEFEELAKELPSDAEVQVAIGAILRRQGAFEKSIAALKRALVLDPQSAWKFSELAHTYRTQRRFEEVFRSQNRAISLDPDNATFYVEKANYLRYAGNLEAARRLLSQAPVTDPMHESWFWQEFFDRNFEAALSHAELMPRGDPLENVSVDWLRCLALFQLTRPEETEEVLLEAVRKAEALVDSGSTFAGHFLGGFYAGLGRKEEAIHAAQQQIALYANDLLLGPLAEEELGYLYALMGEPEAAVGIFDRLLATPYWQSITVERLSIDPRLDSLKSHPGFQAMLRKHE
jgi:serine/threonine protein kinase/tetratricopeptide (TPR) repeat protein